MTQVNLADFAPQLSPEAAEEVLNTLAISYIDFAVDTSLYARMYGVLTGALEGHPEEDKFTVNSCLRTALQRALYSVQGDTETFLGYNLSDRYHDEILPFPSYGKGITNYPGVAAFNVQRVWYDLLGYENEEVSPPVIEAATVVVAGASAFVQLPIDVVDNPEDTMTRSRNTNAAYTYASDYPITRETGSPSYWKVPLNTRTKKYDNETVDVYHMKYTFIDIAPPTLPTGATLEPVYPGTNQIIPQAKPSQILDGGNIRYWFYIYTLVLPEFTYRDVDLIAGEYYKLYQTIAFKYWIEEPAELELILLCGDEETIIQYDPGDPDAPSARAVSALARYGIFHVVVDDCVVTDPCCLYPATYSPTTVSIRVRYRTAPDKLSGKHLNQIPSIRRAVLHKVAAELPVSDCGCVLTKGFIPAQQHVYSDIYMNRFTGVEVERLTYGNRHGQVEYADVMGKVLLIRQPLYP